MPKRRRYDDHFDVVVTDEFFKPITSVITGRERCERFQVAWKEYAAREREMNFGNWAQEILRIISPCYAHQAEYASRVASSIVVWFGTNNGYPFMETLLKGMSAKRDGLSIDENIRFALSTWAVENSLYSNSCGSQRRLLQGILSEDEKIKPLTYLETDTAEKLMIWLGRESGIELLKKLVATSDQFFEDQKRKRLSEKNFE